MVMCIDYNTLGGGEVSSFNVFLSCVIPEVNRCVCYVHEFVWVTLNNQVSSALQADRKVL